MMKFIRYLIFAMPKKARRNINFRALHRKIVILLILLLFLSGSVSIASLDVVASPLRADGLEYIGDLGSIVSKSSSTELSLITTMPVTTGDDIVLALGTDPNSSLVVSVSDDAGNTYNQIGNTVINSGQIRTYLFVAYDVNFMPSGSAITIEATPAVTAHAAVAMLFNGLLDTGGLDQLASSTGTGTEPSSGTTATTTQANELIIGVVGTEGPDGDAAGTWNNAFTAGLRHGTTGGDADTNITISLGYNLVSAIGDYSASKSGITERDWTALIATFKADTSGTHPSIYTTGTPLDTFFSIPGGISDEQSYYVSGSDLTGDIVISAPVDFEISTTSGSGFTNELQLSPTSGSVAETPIYVRFNKGVEGESAGDLVHESSGATTRNIPVSGSSAPIDPVEFNILLARPTDHSITANVIPDYGVEFYVEYGDESGVYTHQSVTYTGDADEAIEFVIDGLDENTRYFYHFVYRRDGIVDWNQGAEHSFITQRPAGSSYTFTIVSDSHLGQYGGQDADELELYALTLANVEADNPDFHIDLGDTYAMDPSPLGTGMTFEEAMAAYYVERPFLGEITHSIPFFQILGNHENEEGWNFDDVFDPPDESLAIAGMTARKYYIPIPVPDDFYTGNTDPLDEAIGGDTYHEDYYAWEWGDVLFVVLDPFHYSMTWPSEGGDTYGGEGQDGEAAGDRWDWSLGIDQYLWFKDVLENSTAQYKFVFSHHVTGGTTQYGRGGISAAPYFEWGGYNADDTWGWDEHRPAAEGWDIPVHQLMVENGVDVFFHGHDHIYAREELDGILYIEVAKPDDAGYDWEPYGYGYNEDLYPDADVILPNSGYMRVDVTPDNVTIEYVRSYLPGDGENGVVADTVVIGPPMPDILGDVNHDGLVNSTDALIILSGDVGINISDYCPINCGDPNADGFVNSLDALLVLRYAVGLPVSFSLGEEGCPAIINQPPGCTP